ncbi:3-hydroxyisobutyryl-CoA hydrolase [Bertholletia excelsa]
MNVVLGLQEMEKCMRKYRKREFLALTGARLNGKELVAAGLATHFVPSEAKLARLWRELLTPTSKGGGGAGEGFDVTKSGDARVGVLELYV